MFGSAEEDRGAAQRQVARNLPRIRGTLKKLRKRVSVMENVISYWIVDSNSNHLASSCYSVIYLCDQKQAVASWLPAGAQFTIIVFFFIADNKWHAGHIMVEAVFISSNWSSCGEWSGFADREI